MVGKSNIFKLFCSYDCFHECNVYNSKYNLSNRLKPNNIDDRYIHSSVKVQQLPRYDTKFRAHGIYNIDDRYIYIKATSCLTSQPLRFCPAIYYMK
jgi:hypothetical protein